jgi:hypothetical protein
MDERKQANQGSAKMNAMLTQFQNGKVCEI